MPIGNRKYKKSAVKSKVMSSNPNEMTHMSGKMMMSQREMDKQMRSMIKKKMM